MSKRVLVLGASGMLGHMLCRVLSQRGLEVYGAQRLMTALSILPEKQMLTFDALSDHSLLAAIGSTRPHFVINCVGLVKQIPGADDSIAAISLNSLLPHRIKKICDSMNVKEKETDTAAGPRLIHISTDCVFSGSKGNYAEDDIADATDLYGRSKLLGEVYGGALTIRTSIIGPQLSVHKSLFDWFVRNQVSSVRGFERAIFSGLTTLELSGILAEIIERFPSLSGLYHIAGQPVDKFTLLNLIRKEYRLSTEIVKDGDLVIDRSLNDQKFRSATGIIGKSWEEMLEQMRRETEMACDAITIGGSRQ